jgi:hypothetical protein
MPLCFRLWIRTSLVFVSLTTPGLALAQGSAGGSIGDDEKSLSGSRSAPRSAEPEAVAPRKPAETSRVSPRKSGGGTNFDGAWIFTSAGCSGSGTLPGVVSGGRLTIQGGGGQVSSNGVLRAYGAGNGMTLNASGRLSGRSGGGSFRRSDGCVGRWSAIRQ